MHSSHHDIFNIPTTLQTQRSIHNTQPGCTLDVLIATAFITNASSMLTADLSERTFDMEEGLSTPVGNRRSFFVKATILISSIIGLSLAIPIVGYLVSPALSRKPNAWVAIGKIDDIPPNEPTALNYSMTVKDGWQTIQATKGIWAVKQSDRQITVYPPLSPHFGCGYRWNRQD